MALDIAARPGPAAPPLLFRPLLPSDRPALAEHLLALLAADRAARWAGAVSDRFVREHCAALGIAGADTVATGVFGADGALLGEAIAARCGPDAVEIAVTVALAWRRRGLGSALVRAAWNAAREELGVRRALLVFDPEHLALAALARGLGATVDTLAGVAELEA
jgi:GNAT superfamily N-acetyltransferase